MKMQFKTFFPLLNKKHRFVFPSDLILFSASRPLYEVIHAIRKTNTFPLLFKTRLDNENMFYVSISLNNRTTSYVSSLLTLMLYNYEIYRSKEFSNPKMSLPLHLERSATPATCQWYKISSFVHFASRKQKLDMSTTLNAIWTQLMVW